MLPGRNVWILVDVGVGCRRLGRNSWAQYLSRVAVSALSFRDSVDANEPPNADKRKARPCGRA